MNDMTVTLPQEPAPGVVRILHTSDWQLGMDRWFLGEEAGPRYREARLAAVERLLATAAARRCAAVVVAGDVFDDNLVDPLTWRRAVDILRGSTVPVFLLPGNHDPYDAASVYRASEFGELYPGVHVLTDNEPRTVPGLPAGVPDVEIIGAPLLSKYMSTDPVSMALAGLREVQHEVDTDGSDDSGDSDGSDGSDDTVRVLVGHGATRSHSSGEDPAVIDVDAAAAACREGVVDMVALGDTHSVTSLHGDGTVWYSGSPEVTDFREEGGGGEARSGYALVVDIAPSDNVADGHRSVTVEEVRTGDWAFLALTAQVNNREDVDDWIIRLDELPNKRTTVVKYAWVGSLDLETAAMLDERTARIAPSFAALYPRERLMDLHVVPGDTELADAQWPGVVGVAARELSQRAADGDGTARNGLRLLYRLSGQKGE